MLKVYLNKHEEERLLQGHPWVFSNEVNHFEGEIKAGCIASVFSFENKFIGKGFFNSNSKIMVRIFSYDENEEINEEFFKKRIEEAWEYRKSIGFTSSSRIVFSEADMLPGLIVDKYGDYLSIQILCLGMEKIKDTIIKILVDIFKPLGIYERSDVSVRKKEGLEEFKGIVYGEFNPIVQIEENDVKMYVDLENGQKTGYFLDQKLNRKNMEMYVKDKVVLDCFSHTGGFALHCAKYKAKEVVAVDISSHAVEDINKNIGLNNFTDCKISAVQADVFEYLRNKDNIYKFDCIILDPPAFTKSKDTVEKAYKGYKDINLQAMKIIKKGGFLFTFSCSQHMTPTLFLNMLQEASIDSKREIQLIDFRIQAPDHPTLMSSDESLYLKCAILHFVN